ncbi:hypothetical protein BH11CYA1_BH11CYA1_12760 [soil metagenome]
MKLSLLTMLLVALLLPQAALAAESAIGWIPTWQQGLEEARQSGKPIMLFSGAPECGGVPGIW